MKVKQATVSKTVDRNRLSFNESIGRGESLVSLNQRFELGFFSPASTNNKSYLGIWYKNYPDIVAWVANRESPLTDSAGTLTIYRDGNLVLLNSSNSIIWSSNISLSSAQLQSSSVVHLLDSGNLVLTQNRSSVPEGSYVWQSFDYPGDTLLPGMKIGWDWTTGKARKLTSWVDTTDPSPGNFVYKMDLLGLPQVVLREGSEKKFRTGVWNGIRLSGLYRSRPTNPLFNYKFTNSTKEINFFYEFTANQTISRLVLNQSGILQRYAIRGGTSEWSLIYETPSDTCDPYAKCGPNGLCKATEDLSCECFHGFIPKSESEWNILDRTNGCIRRKPLNCLKGEGDGFLWINNVKLPDLLAQKFWFNGSMSLKECEQMCFGNCSCTAYANSDITGKGSGCLIWYGDLIDIKTLSNTEGSEQGMYIRLAASELKNGKKRLLVIISVVSAASVMLFVGLLAWCRLRTLKKRRERNNEDIDLPLYDLSTLASATNHFSDTSIIATGGFGPVYKGKLPSGQEIAVKRLSKDSGQGTEEFKNEIILISKLQHRNLVRILGWCLEGGEKLLVYEYMPNESLDKLIFDWKRTTLKWDNRFEIAIGIAKGLVYLHQDSRLRIIHRDLKASNVLLDSELRPKISDFGIARIFGGDQNEAKTKIVIGTYGYMSPEYIIDGKFSAKSDVYSYGVLLLEIVSGLKNTKYRMTEQYHSLLSHAWLLWNEGRTLEIVDRCLEDSYIKSEVQRCIQISLLCVQRSPKDRPTMSSVVSMLENKDVAIPEPKKPGFFIEQVQAETVTELTSGNQLTATTIDAR
ncbi:G-type lectin S-receptor-like serine/threonine-protein kinase At4g27290 isoform X2 [Daucus carota subsp. sativus]|uniref:G-type lectin S-receptor-like serine/threonine-protein kinase At4g27290 isoform X2 n=1 Tax=Daucus carota subsp. sativus TaxID=79200 RepID=UPI0007F01B0F|nr:PREDICTED: G-type lectin S-receptor-like serine/threonine-protein kinase At4g27290 isoform X2 [Daucus carota subsp. sativus]